MVSGRMRYRHAGTTNYCFILTAQGRKGGYVTLYSRVMPQCLGSAELLLACAACYACGHDAMPVAMMFGK